MIRFSRYIWLYFFISGFVLVPGMVALARFGLRPAIDFTGGTLLELKFKTGNPTFDIIAYRGLNIVFLIRLYLKFIILKLFKTERFKYK